MKYFFSVVSIIICQSVYADVNSINCQYEESHLAQVSVIQAVKVANNLNGHIQVRREISEEELKSLIDSQAGCTDLASNKTSETRSEVISTDVLAQEDSHLFYRVNFDFDRSELKDSEQHTLKKLVSQLSSNDMKVKLVGHTDNIGSKKYNANLGYKRSTSVRDYLLSKGIDKKRTNVYSRGEDAPVKSNATKAGRAENRRVDISIYGK